MLHLLLMLLLLVMLPRLLLVLLTVLLECNAVLQGVLGALQKERAESHNTTIT